jgi:hypothetical protein
MPLQETFGAASARGFGRSTATSIPTYIEDVFSTWLYTGNGSTQTITNGIDLSTKGGLTWIKSRSAATDNQLFDTVRGATKELISNSTAAEATDADTLTAFNADGFALGADSNTNTNAATYASWTFRKQPKFFDVVTWTGNGGTSGRTITHNLGSAPGCIIVKKTTSAEDWYVYHRSLGNTGVNQYFCILNSTAAQDTGGFGMEKASNWTATQFALSSGTSALNTNGATYVAYLFAHDAGGFGASGSGNVISCGSYTGTGTAGLAVTLGYEPQWLMVKNAGGTGNWKMMDTMRGMSLTSGVDLIANGSAAESGTGPQLYPTATGFVVNSTSSALNTNAVAYIYIAIRRGPMRTPTTGTSVYQPLTAQPQVGGLFAHNILTDFSFYKFVAGAQDWGVQDRLRGAPDLSFSSTAAESALVGGNSWDVMTGYKNPNPGAGSYASWAFRRAPGFFDVVCYTGTGGTGSRSLTHNLGAAPELIILKRRDAQNWQAGSMFTSTTVTRAVLNRNDSQDLNSLYSGQSIWGGQPTSSAFLIDASGSFNTNAATYVAYLFATVAGVSKVGSYTGTGTTLQVNCGFTGGSRFVLIKRTDSTGDWYVWDSARGIVAGNDPYLLLSSPAAEVTGTDYIDTFSSGFEISSTAPAAINANGGTFIFLAIA